MTSTAADRISSILYPARDYGIDKGKSAYLSWRQQETSKPVSPASTTETAVKTPPLPGMQTILNQMRNQKNGVVSGHPTHVFMQDILAKNPLKVAPVLPSMDALLNHDAAKYSLKIKVNLPKMAEILDPNHNKMTFNIASDPSISLDQKTTTYQDALVDQFKKEQQQKRNKSVILRANPGHDPKEWKPKNNGLKKIITMDDLAEDVVFKDVKNPTASNSVIYLAESLNQVKELPEAKAMKGLLSATTPVSRRLGAGKEK